MQLLQNKLAVVTGSSSGIGRAIAIELASSGANVIVHAAQDADGAQKTATAVQEQGRQCKVILADIADAEQRNALVNESWSVLGPVDIWVNNAGADVLTGEAAKWSFERKLQRLWEVDVVGTIAISRDVGARMHQMEPNAENTPSIVNIGWDQAAVGMGGESGELFATSKGAIMAFTKSLARSLAPKVRVNCVAPGWIKTKWGDDAPEYWNQRAISESLLQRWGRPEDVAKTIRHVVSPDAAFISGQILNVNGGYRGEIQNPQ